MAKRKREIDTRECAICAEEKPLYRNFPQICTSPHDPDTCLDCYSKQTVIQLETNRTWDACTCPQCTAKLPTEILQTALPRSIVREMKVLVHNAYMSSDDAWRWCLVPNCGHGSLQNASKSHMIKCHKCGAKSCFTHQVPWHQGYTCERYDTSHPASAITKTDEETIRKMSKACPHCGWRVQKDGGCNHMHCTKCKRAWFWNTVAFDGETQPSAAEYVGGPEPHMPAGMVDPGVLQHIMNMQNMDLDRTGNGALLQQPFQLFQPLNPQDNPGHGMIFQDAVGPHNDNHQHAPAAIDADARREARRAQLEELLNTIPPHQRNNNQQHAQPMGSDANDWREGSNDRRRGALAELIRILPEDPRRVEQRSAMQIVDLTQDSDARVRVPQLRPAALIAPRPRAGRRRRQQPTSGEVIDLT